MNDIPLRSYVYYALCELCDASENIETILSRLDDNSVKALVTDIYNDVENSIIKLQSLSL